MFISATLFDCSSRARLDYLSSSSSSSIGFEQAELESFELSSFAILIVLIETCKMNTSYQLENDPKV